jgi:hypothetical protein
MEKNAKWILGKDGKILEKGIFVIKFKFQFLTTHKFMHSSTLPSRDFHETKSFSPPK